MAGLNKALAILSGLSGMNYKMQEWQELIAEVKASGADEATQSGFCQWI